jgi:hypothetical protein
MKERGGEIVNQASTVASLPGSFYRFREHAVAPSVLATEASYRAGGPQDSEGRQKLYATIPNN